MPVKSINHNRQRDSTQETPYYKAIQNLSGHLSWEVFYGWLKIHELFMQDKHKIIYTLTYVKTYAIIKEKEMII